MSVAARERLPVHGFVLAGGKSSRMGQDKALLPFRGRPMVEIAVEKLRSFCAEVSIVGNRDDLASFAPVVHEARLNAGPVAGIEAGMQVCKEPWSLFVPVDVPLLPGAVLAAWAEQLDRFRFPGLSFLISAGERQPAFCAVHRDLWPIVGEVLDSGERSVAGVLYGIAARGECELRPMAVESLAPEATPLEVERWFSNLNSPSELRMAEAWTE